MCRPRPITLALLAGLGAVVACYSPPMSQTGTNVAVLTRTLEGMSQGDFELFDEICAPGYRGHLSGAVVALDCAGHKRDLRRLGRAFGGLETRIDEMFAAGDRVVFRLTRSGTHRGEYLGIPPTGNEVRFNVLGVARMVNGQLIEMWTEQDWPTLFDQLGTTPPEWHRRWADRLFDPVPTGQDTTGGN